MTRKTQEEVNFWFQDNTIKSALDLTLIEKKLHNNGLDIPNNVIIHKNGSTYEDFAHWYYDETKISKYPKTYKECLVITSYNKEKISLYLLDNFRQLLICRDAYWKIAGEQMGLGNPWEPDWKNEEQNKYCIYYGDGNIQKGTWCIHSSILAFPTEEMRDVFYENFKGQIETCKTLL